MGLLEETTDERYHEWWLAQFPCPCGHPPERHFLAPVKGGCRACLDCHGEFPAILAYAEAIGGTVHNATHII